MTDGTQTKNSENPAVLYMALELSSKTWMLAFGDGSVRKPRRVTIEARALAALAREIAKAKERLGLDAEARVVSCYEAGRDGFWIDRALSAMGVDNHVVESSSIEVPRQFRRAKTDAIDVDALLRMLIRFENGETKVWHTVHVPSVEDEDARRPTRERERVQKEITSLRNRMLGLLATEGVFVKAEALPELLSAVRTPDGRELSPHLKNELLREHARLMLMHTQLKEIDEAQRKQTVGTTTFSDQALTMMSLKGVGPHSARVLAAELFCWRRFKNRRELAAIAGLCATPYQSGSGGREQGISKAGNKRVRWSLIELAWLWLQWQPESELSKWFNARWGASGNRSRKVGIVALARKLLIALWHLVEHGAIPRGAVLKPSVGVTQAKLESVRSRDVEARARHDARSSTRFEGVKARVAPGTQLPAAS